jgi:Putative prokaryotic signal transducing protein
MREILRTNNPIVLSFVEVLLRDAGLAPVVVDVNMSVAEGSIGILPRRILVGSEDWTRARQVLDDAGLGAWTIDDDVA